MTWEQRVTRKKTATTWGQVIVCGSGEVGPQCGYVSYLAGMEYGPKRVKMHRHLNPDGSWRETAWGPQENCIERASR